MTQILTLEQAKAIAHSVASLAVVGARPAKVVTPGQDGAVAVTRCKLDGTIVVCLLSPKMSVIARRKYDGLARFVAEHQEHP